MKTVPKDITMINVVDYKDIKDDFLVHEDF